MIDPGHGGTDPGNISTNKKSKQEKDINLAIAKKLGALLTDELENVKIVYTRTEDKFVSLDDRVVLANSKKVDYFISIHCNSSKNKSINGTESHVHTTKEKKSYDLAKEIEKEFKGKAKRTSRGVKNSSDRTHSLQVLKFTQMTSVLVECGFMSNSKEVSYLNTSAGQTNLASAIFRALKTIIKKQHPSISIAKKVETNSSEKPNSGEENKKKTVYTIQIMSSKEWMDTEKGAFKKLSKEVIRKEKKGTSFKYVYYSGSFTTKKEAEVYKKEVQKFGFKDAFVVLKT